jgi:zinc protease
MEREQAFVTVGFEAPTIGDEMRHAMEVIYAILSGQGGRLFYELRDKRSLAYSVYASMILGLDTSAFTINIGTSPEKIDDAVAGILAEVERLTSEPPTEDEVARAKRYLMGNHDIGLQKTSSRAMSFGLDELYGFGYRKTLDFSDRMEAITRQDLADFVEGFLDPDRATVSITHPPGAKFEAGE